MEITSEFNIKDTILNINNNSQDLKTTTNLMRKCQNTNCTKGTLYQRPCTLQTLRSQDSLSNSCVRKQKQVCHTRDCETLNKSVNETNYSKSLGRRVSIASTWVL